MVALGSASITIAFAPASLLAARAGRATVALFKAASVKVAPALRAMAEDSRSAEESPVSTVYVPDAVVLSAKAAILTTEPVSKVTFKALLVRQNGSLKRKSTPKNSER